MDPGPRPKQKTRWTRRGFWKGPAGGAIHLDVFCIDAIRWVKNVHLLHTAYPIACEARTRQKFLAGATLCLFLERFG